MAGGEKLGSLYFDLGIDEKDFESKMKAILSKDYNIKIGVDVSGLSEIRKQLDAIQKSGIKTPTFLQATKADNSVLESAQKQLLIQQKIATEVERTALAHKRLETAGSQSQSRINSNSEWTNKTLLSQRQIAMQLSNQFGTMFSIYAVERFIKKLADVRGEFEQQKIALESILQDGQAANKIFEQIKNLSVESPFRFKDLVGYTKQLSAFQIPAAELYDTMKRLADVSSGLGVGMDRIVLAFGQVRSASVLRGQELRQFTEAGIPLVQMLADKFSLLEHRTVTTGDVFERISKRMVSFGDVKGIFDDLTSAGGKFYEMQEKQAKGLLGMMTNLQDAIDIALNDIGESNEGILKGAVQLTTNLINNWESVARVVMTAVAAYGSYKTVMLINAALNSNFVAGLALQSARLAMITSEMGAATAAQYALNTAVSLNPWTVAALAIGAVVGAMVLFSGSSKNAKDEIDKLNKSTLESSKNASKVSELVSAYDKLSSSAAKSSDEQTRLRVVIKELAKLYPDLVTKTDQYGNAIDVNIKKVKNLSDAMKQNLLIIARQNIEQAKSEIGKSSSSNRAIEQTLKSGVITSTVYNENGPKQITSQLSISERKRLQEEYDSNQKIIDGFLGTIQNSADLINQLKGNYKKAKDEMSDWAQWAKNFKKQTDDLKITGSISSLFTQQNMEGGSLEFKASLQKAYDEDLKQYQIYTKSKGLFSAKEVADLKKKVSDEKTALELLGGTKEENKPDKTDYIAIRLENEIKLVRSLYSEYEKLKKTQGADAAKNIISTAPEYASSRNKLSAIGVSVEFSQDKMDEQVSKLIERTQQTKKVKEIGASWASNIDKGFAEKFNETFENIVKTIEQAISDYKPKYDLYEKLLGLTGDSESANIIAFGSKTSVDLETFMKSKFTSISGGFYDAMKKPLDTAKPEVIKLWNEITEYISSKRVTRIELWQQYIDEAKSSNDKIVDLERLRDNELKEANSAYLSEVEGKTGDVANKIFDIWQNRLGGINDHYNNKIQDVKSSLFQLTPLYQELFKDIDNMSTSGLDKLLEKTKGVLNIIKNPELATPKLDADKNVLGYDIKKGTTDPTTGTVIEKDTYIKVGEVNSLLKKTNELKNKINENPIKSLFDPAVSGEVETMQEKLKRFSKAIQQISDLAQSVSGDVGSIMDSFGVSSESQATLKNITDIAGGASSIATGILSGDPVQAIKGVVGGISKVITGLNAIHDAKYEKQIKEYQKQIDSTVKSYDALTDALSRKTEASKLDANAENYNLLQREKNLIEQQKLAEESKKKSDQSKIDDYNKQIEDLAKKQQELAYNTISSVLGGSIGSQADSWAKTLTNAMDTAFQNGTDAAQAWGDSVDSIVRDIAKNFVVNSFLGKQLQNWLEEASADWTNADKSVNQKNIEDDLKGFSTFAKSLEPATEAALKALNSIYGDGTSSSSSTLSSNIKGVTENTADRLASMINAIRQDSAVIRATTSLIRDIMQSYGSGNTEANSYLQKMDANIRQNTLNTTAILSAIQDVTTNGANGKALKLA